jgi:hypothetical protein
VPTNLADPDDSDFTGSGLIVLTALVAPQVVYYGVAS